MGTIITRVYRDGALQGENFPLAGVSEHLDADDTIVWIDICGPSAAELAELADELRLHELAIEDALGPHQRPKLDRYTTHLFLACHAVRVEGDSGSLEQTEVDAFIHRRWLITVRKDDGFGVDGVLARVDRSPDLTRHGVSYFLYALLDEVVDTYFAAIDAFDDYYDDIGDRIFSEHPLEPSQQRRWFEMRRALSRFHRLVIPMRETVSALLRHEHSAVATDLYPYFQDVYDHILRVSESSDSLRELVGTIVETNLSLRDYRQNQIVKKVSSWAAIIAVPALITGYFGMNVPYPGSGETSGVIVATGIIAAAPATLYMLFRRLDWL